MKIAVKRPKLLKQIPSVSLMLLIILIVMSIFADGFFSFSNLINIVRQSAVLIILSLAVTVIILSGGIDLSTGAVMSLSGVAAVIVLNSSQSLVLALLSGILTGVLCGLINGLLVSAGKLPPFIATFGMQCMAPSVGLFLTNGSSVPVTIESFAWAGSGMIGSVPVPVMIALFIYVIVFILLYHTKFGTYVFGIGGSEEGCKLSGINVKKWKTLFYIFSGTMCGVAGIVMSGRMYSGNPINGLGWEFDAIAATIIGGTAFSEGKGGITGTIIAALLISVVRNGLNMIGVPTNWQMAVTGVVVLSAILIDIVLSNQRRQVEL